MAARLSDAGDGPRKRALSCGSSNSSDDEDIEFVSESESDIDFEHKTDLDDDHSVEEDDTLGSVRVWQRVNTENPPPAPPRFPFCAVPGILREPTDERDILGWFGFFFFFFFSSL
ncbi:hypothetical protein ISCGN_029873 [Ixodes scapularis]